MSAVVEIADVVSPFLKICLIQGTSLMLTLLRCKIWGQKNYKTKLSLIVNLSTFYEKRPHCKIV